MSVWALRAYQCSTLIVGAIFEGYIGDIGFIVSPSVHSFLGINRVSNEKLSQTHLDG